MADYGQLGQVVAYAGFATAASLAIRVTWAGKLIWEPDIRGLGKAPARMAGVISAVVIVLLFAYTRGSNDWKWLTPYALTFAGIGIFSLLAYIIFLAACTVQCAEDRERTVAGFWKTSTAKQILAGKSPYLPPGQLPPETVKELFCGSGRDPDRVWPPLAQGLAKAALVLIYIAFIAPATLAIATGAIILEKASQPIHLE